MSVAVSGLAWNWTTVLPRPSFPLPQVLDLLNSTCVQLDDDKRDVHLRGQLSGTFNSLLVSLTFATSMAFGPGPGQATCHPMTSSLMTHQRSDCNQTVCAIPTACRYTGIKSISIAPNLWAYDFICVCHQAWCNELLLWLRPNSVHGIPKGIQLCEVEVSFWWFVRVASTNSFCDDKACSRWINPPVADTVCRPHILFSNRRRTHCVALQTRFITFHWCKINTCACAGR